MGFTAIDNGYLGFDHFRIPRDNMLMKVWLCVKRACSQCIVSERQGSAGWNFCEPKERKVNVQHHGILND